MKAFKDFKNKQQKCMKKFFLICESLFSTLYTEIKKFKKI